MAFFKKVRLPGRALSRHLIMRELAENKKTPIKWKEAGTYVPARMKKKNIYKKDIVIFLTYTISNKYG